MTTDKTFVLILGYNEAYDEFHEGVLRALKNDGWLLKGVVGNGIADKALIYYSIENDTGTGRFYGDRCYEKALELHAEKCVVVAKDVERFKVTLIDTNDLDMVYIHHMRQAIGQESQGGVTVLLQQMGYYETLKVIKNLGGIRYYLSGVPVESEIVKAWCGLSEEKILVMKSIWASSLTSSYRYMFEVAIPNIAKELLLDDGFTYMELHLSMLEYYASKLGMSRFKTYTYESLKEGIISALSTYKKEQPIEIALELLIK